METKQTVAEYIKNRLENFVNSLRGEGREMWVGDDAIHSLSNWRGIVAEAIEEFEIKNISDARKADLEALWE